MFNYLIGKITEIMEGSLVIECNNIGFEVFASNYTLRSLENVGEEVKLYIYFHLKEDGVSLYGFCDKVEKDIFLKLISVSGVGPKGAMAILSNIKSDELCKVIASQDISMLSSVKGVGKKTAERLIIELKDKINVIHDDVIGDIKLENNEINDACEVLVGLGLSKMEALKYARSCYKMGDSAEDIISKSLFLMKK